MHVALVTPFTTRPGLSTGGVESVAECLVTALARRTGARVDVLAPSLDGRADVEQREFGRVHWLPQVKPAVLGYWTMFRRRVHRRLNELKPDVAHFQGYTGWTLGYRAPSVVTIHGIPELDTRYSAKPGSRLRSLIVHGVESFGRARSDAKIVINPYVSAVLGDRLQGRHWEIENPVHADFFSLERTAQRGRLLYVGRISARKNIEGLLRSFARVLERFPKASLRLAGNAEDAAFLARCHALAGELGIADHVCWLGNLPRQELLVELSSAAALVLVSRQETAPMAIAEAMAASLPVVASRICGNPYLVDDGETGLLVDPADVESIAARLIEVLEPATNEKMGAQARLRAMARFDPDVVAQRTCGVYESVLAHSRKSVRS